MYVAVVEDGAVEACVAVEYGGACFLVAVTRECIIIPFLACLVRIASVILGVEGELNWDLTIEGANEAVPILAAVRAESPEAILLVEPKAPALTGRVLDR